uniref:Uncharacterized protein n=1 Tax=Oryza glumipatula TaxID=40148 RepID=A0A0E0B6X5_9ORYZ
MAEKGATRNMEPQDSEQNKTPITRIPWSPAWRRVMTSSRPLSPAKVEAAPERALASAQQATGATPPSAAYSPTPTSTTTSTSLTEGDNAHRDFGHGAPADTTASTRTA